MIVVYWNVLLFMIFVYIFIINYFLVKGYMVVMKLLCCVLFMLIYIKCLGILMFINIGFFILWFWKCFFKIIF